MSSLDKARQTQIDNIQKKTGQSLDELTALVHKSGLNKHGEIWRTVEKLNPQGWETLKNKLKQSYQRVDKLFHDTENWDEDVIGAALAIVVHNAYLWVRSVTLCEH